MGCLERADGIWIGGTGQRGIDTVHANGARGTDHVCWDEKARAPRQEATLTLMARQRISDGQVQWDLYRCSGCARWLSVGNPQVGTCTTSYGDDHHVRMTAHCQDEWTDAGLAWLPAHLQDRIVDGRVQR
mgnify:CR=1 FL=1